MVDEKTLEKIIAYTNHTLSDSERRQFEKELENDPTLSDAVDAYNDSRDVLLSGGRKEIRNLVENAFENQANNKKTKPGISRLRIVMGLAAAVLLLITTFFVFDIFKTAPSPEALFATHFEMPAPPAVRSGATDQIENWQEAIGAYSSGEFNTVIELMKLVLQNPDFTQKEEARLIMGAAYLQLDQNKNALTQFQEVNPISSFKGQADWLAALTYLKIGELEAARLSLQSIVEKNGYKSKEAKDILQHL